MLRKTAGVGHRPFGRPHRARGSKVQATRRIIVRSEDPNGCTWARRRLRAQRMIVAAIASGSRAHATFLCDGNRVDGHCSASRVTCARSKRAALIHRTLRAARPDRPRCRPRADRNARNGNLLRSRRCFPAGDRGRWRRRRASRASAYAAGDRRSRRAGRDTTSATAITSRARPRRARDRAAAAGRTKRQGVRSGRHQHEAIDLVCVLRCEQRAQLSAEAAMSNRRPRERVRSAASIAGRSASRISR